MTHGDGDHNSATVHQPSHKRGLPTRAQAPLEVNNGPTICWNNEGLGPLACCALGTLPHPIPFCHIWGESISNKAHCNFRWFPPDRFWLWLSSKALRARLPINSCPNDSSTVIQRVDLPKVSRSFKDSKISLKSVSKMKSTSNACQFQTCSSWQHSQSTPHLKIQGKAKPANLHEASHRSAMSWMDIELWWYLFFWVLRFIFYVVP